jgi:hypothetical protein
MFGFAFIIIGIVLLLQAAGAFGTVSAGVIWGVVFILIGISIAIRRSVRRKRRMEWMARHHGDRERKAAHQETPEK